MYAKCYLLFTLRFTPSGTVVVVLDQMATDGSVIGSVVALKRL